MYELAVAEYRSFLDQHEDHAKVPLARYGLSVSLFRMGKFDEAADELTTLRKRLEGASAPPDFEFKAEVVTLCERGDRSIGQVARDLDLTHILLKAAAFFARENE